MKMRLEQFSLDSGEYCLIQWPEQFTEFDRIDMLEWMDLIKRKIENAEIKPSNAQRDPQTPPKEN